MKRILILSLIIFCLSAIIAVAGDLEPFSVLRYNSPTLAEFTTRLPVAREQLSFTFNVERGGVAEYALYQPGECLTVIDDVPTVTYHKVCVNKTICHDIPTVEWDTRYATVPCRVPFTVSDTVILSTRMIFDGFGYAVDWIPAVDGIRKDAWAWWNVTFPYRVNVTYYETVGVSRDREFMKVTLRNLTGMTNCTRELRVTARNGTEIPSQVFEFNATSCRVGHLVTVPRNGNATYCYYYGNSNVTAPVYTDYIVVNETSDDTITTAYLYPYRMRLDMLGGAHYKFKIDNVTTNILDETNDVIYRVENNTNALIDSHNVKAPCVQEYDGVLEARYNCSLISLGNTFAEYTYRPGRMDTWISVGELNNPWRFWTYVDESLDGNYYYDNTSSAATIDINVSYGYLVNDMVTEQEVFFLWDEDKYINESSLLRILQIAGNDGSVWGRYDSINVAIYSENHDMRIRAQLDNHTAYLNTVGRRWELAFDNPINATFTQSARDEALPFLLLWIYPVNGTNVTVDGMMLTNLTTNTNVTNCTLYRNNVTTGLHNDFYIELNYYNYTPVHGVNVLEWDCGVIGTSDIVNFTACVPEWACTEFSACNGTFRNCVNVTDEHECGLNYTGEYTEFRESCSITSLMTGTCPESTPLMLLFITFILLSLMLAVIGIVMSWAMLTMLTALMIFVLSWILAGCHVMLAFIFFGIGVMAFVRSFGLNF